MQVNKFKLTFNADYETKKIPGNIISPGDVNIVGDNFYLNDIPKPVDNTLYCALV